MGDVQISANLRPALNDIAERLWEGRAAVMVGSGFSKNADKSCPNWSELGDILYEKAHGVMPSTSDKQYLDLMRLAEEVEASAGKLALENLLYKSIPDASIQPSSLHVKLLNFPWADVFTTNYDTLLERASHQVANRRYVPVITKADLPYAKKPRIVKLHGSFPSARPFIVTEEDYRQYPQTFAPFVNTVQQSLLENTFCLIGFSGDDPNFQKWIGWIRDNLGRKNTHKIYMVGVFNLTNARKKLLTSRGIEVVDMSGCEGIENHDHKEALKLFLKYLEQKNPNSLEWPIRPQTTIHSIRQDSNGLALSKLIEEWRDTRASYPGWLVAPYRKRKKLINETIHWINFKPDFKNNSPEVDIQYYSELNWRLERCLLSLGTGLVEQFEALLKKYWPFPSDTHSFPKAQFVQGRDELTQSLRWEDIREYWLSLALALLRFYREEGNHDNYRKIKRCLLKQSDFLSSEQQEFFHYQCYLYCLFTLDVAKAKAELESWHPSKALPYWETIKALACVELGVTSNAEEQIRTALVKTRTQGRNAEAGGKFDAESSESYQMLLLQFVLDSQHWMPNSQIAATQDEIKAIEKQFKNDLRKNSEQIALGADSGITTGINIENEWSNLYSQRGGNFKDKWDMLLRSTRRDAMEGERRRQNQRLDELKASDCDPYGEIALLELELSKTARKPLTEEPGFDIGKHSFLRNMVNFDSEVHSGYVLLRFCEEIGLPFKIGNVTFLSKEASKSAAKISKYNGFWATATLFRLGDDKAVEQIFSRDSIFALGTEGVDQTVNRYLALAESLLPKANVQNEQLETFYDSRVAQLTPEIISRFCCRSSKQTKKAIIAFLSNVYASPQRHKFKSIKNLLARLLQSLSNIEKYNLLPELLAIECPKGYSMRDEFEFPNPFISLLNSPLIFERNYEGLNKLKIDKEIVSNLINAANQTSSEQRNWGLTSLICLYQLGLLDDHQANQLGDAIWHGVVGTNQMPNELEFFNFAYLTLPHPADVDPEARFRSYVETSFFPVSEDKSVTITGGRISLANEILGANKEGFWKPRDVIDIFQKLITWWDCDKSRLRAHNNKIELEDDLIREFKSRFSNLVEIITQLVGPKLPQSTPKLTGGELKRLLLELDEHGISSYRAQAACVRFFPELNGELYEKIANALVSDEKQKKMDALRSIQTIWLNEPSTELVSLTVDLLGEYIKWGHFDSTSDTLLIVTSLIKKSPAYFSESLELTLLNRLKRLLEESTYDSGLPVAIEKKLEVRRSALGLSSVLENHFLEKYDDVPTVIKSWKEVAFSDVEFSDVKNAWVDNR